MTDEQEDCCPDCKKNVRGLEDLRKIAMKHAADLMPKAINTPPKSPYKNTITLGAQCEGKAGETLEMRIVATERPCKPQKLIIIESEPKATSFGLRLANGPHASLFPPHLPEMVESHLFSAEAQALGCGIGLPALHLGDAYVLKFKFERDAKVTVVLSCVEFRS